MTSIRTILYSSHFERAMQRLQHELQGEFLKREAIFRRDCFDSRLNTHKLHGRHHECWSFSVTHSCRIVFRFLEHNKVLFIDIGNHSIYK